jgi:hypothetical protein
MEKCEAQNSNSPMQQWMVLSWAYRSFLLRLGTNGFPLLSLFQIGVRKSEHDVVEPGATLAPPGCCRCRVVVGATVAPLTAVTIDLDR